jgi:hypothetical protein
MYNFNDTADVDACLKKLSTVQGQITKAKNQVQKNLDDASYDLMMLKLSK